MQQNLNTWAYNAAIRVTVVAMLIMAISLQSTLAVHRNPHV